jgi:hypothetical protein
MSRSRAHDRFQISVVEIYNETIYDLLDRGREKEPKKLGVTTTGETEIQRVVELQISSVADVQSIIDQTENSRHRGSTELNRESSRSHTVFRVRLTNRKGSCCLSIVDLAGCERLSTINSTRGSFKEACNINKSMLVLGKCIRRLKEQTATGRKLPIPYRESKLTHLFKSFFEPQFRVSQASIIINVSPSMVQFEDTVFALQFAADAAQCVIRQRKQPLPIIREEEEEDTSETDTSIETPEAMELRIRSEVEQEMLEIIERKERRSGATMHEMREIVRALQNQHDFHELSAIQAANNVMEKANSALRQSVHSLEVELDQLEMRRVAVSCENARLSDLISSLQH